MSKVTPIYGIPKIVIYNTVFNATPFTCFVNTKWVADFNVLLIGGKVKNVDRDAQRYLQKLPSNGKCENNVWICSIFRIMWVKFQVMQFMFQKTNNFRWPIYGTGK